MFIESNLEYRYGLSGIKKRRILSKKSHLVSFNGNLTKLFYIIHSLGLNHNYKFAFHSKFRKKTIFLHSDPRLELCKLTNASNKERHMKNMKLILNNILFEVPSGCLKKDGANRPYVCMTNNLAYKYSTELCEYIYTIRKHFGFLDIPLTFVFAYSEIYYELINKIVNDILYTIDFKSFKHFIKVLTKRILQVSPRKTNYFNKLYESITEKENDLKKFNYHLENNIKPRWLMLIGFNSMFQISVKEITI